MLTNKREKENVLMVIYRWVASGLLLWTIVLFAVSDLFKSSHNNLLLSALRLIYSVSVKCASSVTRLSYFFLKQFKEAEKSIVSFLYKGLLAHNQQKTQQPKSYTIEESCHSHGYGCLDHVVLTKDGFYLHLQRLSKNQQHQGPPVVLMHGLFMSAGVFVTNEEESLAFFLLEKGYDVWLANNRLASVEDSFIKNHLDSLKKDRNNSHHIEYEPTDKGYWDWCLDDIGTYDVTAIVDYVLKVNGAEKLTWIGLSQGNAQAFVSLSSNEEISNKFLIMVALAPTARIGQLPSWPLKYLQRDEIYDWVIGHYEFVPMINWVARVCPASIFSHVAYPMFFYLFKWSDSRWKKSRKVKYFQTTPRPCSTKLIRHWMKIAEKGRLIRFDTEEPYPTDKITTPLAIFYGQSDDLVDAKTYIRDILKNPSNQLRHHEEVKDYEHTDLVWAENSSSTIFEKIHSLVQNEIEKN